jgi:hypothetical protein
MASFTKALSSDVAVCAIDTAGAESANSNALGSTTLAMRLILITSSFPGECLPERIYLSLEHAEEAEVVSRKGLLR